MIEKEIRMSDSPAPATKAPLWVPVRFETGFERGDDQITAIKVRKPKAGELRGLNLQSLLNGDVNAIIAVLPRISDPVMTTADVESLEADDLTEAADAVTGFFLSASQRKMVAELQSRI